jgi:hypothetical protein
MRGRLVGKGLPCIVADESQPVHRDQQTGQGLCTPYFKERKRVCEGTGIIAAVRQHRGRGIWQIYQAPFDKIAAFNFDEQEGRVTIAENDPTTVEVQQKTSTGIP